MYKYFCENGCPRKHGSDGHERVRFDEEDNSRIITYNCNICGRTSIHIERSNT